MTADYNPHAIATADQLAAARAAVDTINDLKQRVTALELADLGHRTHAEIVNETVANLIAEVNELHHRTEQHRDTIKAVNVSITSMIEMDELLAKAIEELRRRP